MSDNDIALRPGNGAAIAQAQPPILGGGGLVSVEQQRALGELQAQIMLAKLYPRDQAKVVADLKRLDCTRPGLALASEYSFSRGGQDVTGPSIRLMEAIARRWGNIQSGIKEVSRGVDNEIGYSECVAYAWDLETGYRDERQFRVRHLRDTRRGQQKLSDERDVYELIANYGQRRKRACLEAVIPGDVVEEVQEECRKTLNAEANTGPEAIKRLLAAFAAHNVSQRQIERRIQRNIDAIRPAQVVQLRKVYASLQDGMTTVEAEFETEPEPRPTRQPAAPAQAAEVPQEPPPPAQEPPAPPPPTPEPPAPPAEEPPPPPAAAAPTIPSEPPGNGETVAFEHAVVDPGGISEDGELYLDPLRWAQAFLDIWNRCDSGSREGLLAQNADALQDARKMDPQADALLDGVEVAPPNSNVVEPDKDERMANHLIVEVSGMADGAAVIAFSKSPTVMVPINRWNREGKEALVARVKAVFTKRLAELKGGQ